MSIHKKITLYSKNEEIGVDKSIVVNTHELKSDYPLHTHDYFEIEIYLSGNGTNFINKNHYPLKRGSVVFMTPRDVHRMEFDGKAKILNISFDSSVISESMLKRIYATKEYKYYFDKEELCKIEYCAKILQCEIETTGIIKPLLEYLLSLILVDNNEKADEDPLHFALEYINMNFREQLTVEKVAKVVHLNPVYFGHLFKKSYGVSFNSYLNSRKVMFAKNLLINGMKVTEACFESGFESLSNFLKVFKAQTGQSPKEYQKKKKETIKNSENPL